MDHNYSWRDILHGNPDELIGCTSPPLCLDGGAASTLWPTCVLAGVATFFSWLSLPGLIPSVLVSCRTYGASPFSQSRPSKTYKIGFWMRKYASMSWKRTWVWSSSSRIHELDLGPLTTDEKNESKTLTTRYRDSKGKVKFQGNSSLKGSQRL